VFPCPDEQTLHFSSAGVVLLLFSSDTSASPVEAGDLTFWHRNLAFKF
jgi:hypothetical protein